MGGADVDPEESQLVERLRAGDGAAFRRIVLTYHASMVRVAAAFVPDAAEDVVQETWLAVIRGIDGFEGRSSLRSWVFAILLNRARTAARRARTQATPTDDLEGPAVDPARFTGPAGRGRWAAPLVAWQDDPQLRHASGETLREIAELLAGLPPRQRQVLVLRDVEGWSAAEVCAALDLTVANQRVLLHRGRAALRRGLEKRRDPR